MTGPIYKLWMSRMTEAWCQLSEEEQNEKMAKAQEVLRKVGGKTILTCTPIWSNEEWMLFGVEEFPDEDAIREHSELLYKEGHFRYANSRSILGVKWPLE